MLRDCKFYVGNSAFEVLCAVRGYVNRLSCRKSCSDYKRVEIEGDDENG